MAKTMDCFPFGLNLIINLECGLNVELHEEFTKHMENKLQIELINRFKNDQLLDRMTVQLNKEFTNE